MNVGELLGPWLALAAVLVPLVYAERWIHSHLFGVAWLATNSRRSATALYYLLLLPGVFVHELTQYLVAGALNVPIQRVIAWPEAQEDGTLRLDFVQVKDQRRLSAAIIGAAPLLVGLGIVWVISNHVLDLDAVVRALASADWRQIGPALRTMVSKSDFFLWLYLVFAVSNAMLPTAADRRGWPLLLSLFAVALIVLVLIGVGDVLLEVFTTSVAMQVERLAAALAAVVFVEALGIGFIGVLEEVLERVTKRKFTYRREEKGARRQTAARQPGSSAPLPPGTPFPSIYNLDLPVPLPADARRSAAPATARPGVPAAPLPAMDADQPGQAGLAETAGPRHAAASGLGPAPRTAAEFPPQVPRAFPERGPLPASSQSARQRPGAAAPERAQQPPRPVERPLSRPPGTMPALPDDEPETDRTSVGDRTDFFRRQAPAHRSEGEGLTPRRALPHADEEPAARMGRSLGLGRPAPLPNDEGDEADEQPLRARGPFGPSRRTPPLADADDAADEVSDETDDEDVDPSDDLRYVPFDDVDLT